MKKFLQLVLVAVVSLTFVSSVKAEVTAKEQELIDYASQTFTIGGEEHTYPELAAIVKAFVTDTNTSDENVDKVLAEAKAIVALVEASGETDFTKLPADTKSSIKEHASNIQNLVPVNFNYNNATGELTVKGAAGSGKVYGQVSLTDPNTLKATGADYTVYFVISGLVMSIAAVVLYRKSKVNA